MPPLNRQRRNQTRPHKTLTRDEWTRTWDTLGVILDADSVVVFVTIDHSGQASGLDVITSDSSIGGLHYDHVAAIAALREQPAGCGVGSEGRDDLCDFER